MKTNITIKHSPLRFPHKYAPLLTPSAKYQQSGTTTLIRHLSNARRSLLCLADGDK